MISKKLPRPLIPSRVMKLAGILKPDYVISVVSQGLQDVGWRRELPFPNP